MTTTQQSPPQKTVPGTAQAATRDQRRQQTHQLLAAVQGTADPCHRAQLRHEVVLINREVADAVARRYRNRGIPWDDLRQTAYEGLIKAVTRFDPTVRPDLLTYAVPTIRGELQRLFRDRSWMVRPPRRIQENQWRVNQSIDLLSQRLGREPTRAEVCEDVGLTPEDLNEALTAFGCFRPPSIEQPVNGTETVLLGDLLPLVIDDAHAATEARLALAELIRALEPADQEIIFLRFFEDLDQTEIGARLGMTQASVSRRLNRIYTRLRPKLADDAARPLT